MSVGATTNVHSGKVGGKSYNAHIANAEPQPMKKKNIFGDPGVHLTPQQKSGSVFA